MTASPFLLIGLLALLYAGAWGLGRLTVLALERSGWAEAPEVLGPALQLVLGMAVVIALGGVLVAADLAYPAVLLALQVVGALALVPPARAALSARRPLGLPGWVRGVALGAAGAFVALLALGQAVGYQLYNPLDDDAAYVYLARRLVATGGLVDPFNFRRITSYGAGTLYQSLFLQVSGNASLRAFELVFAMGVLVVVTVGTLRRRWLVPGILVLGTGLAVGGGIGPIDNLSPLFSVAALSVATYVVLRRVPARGGAGPPQLYLVLGLLMAAILALRFYFLISVVGAVVFVLVALQGWRSVRSMALIAAAAVVATLGWAVALLRSSGTPVFPVIFGNYNTDWPSSSDPTVHGLHNHLELFLKDFTGFGVGWPALVAVGVALVYLVGRGPDPVRMVVVLGAGLGCLVQIAVVSVSFSALTSVDLGRVIAASTLAAALAALEALWPLREPPGAATPGPVPVAPARGWARVGAVLGSAPGRGVLCAAVVAVALNVTPLAGYSTAVRSYAADGARVLAGTIPLRDRYVAWEPQYDTLNRLVPPGAKVLAAVDLPSLLDPTRYDVATVDFPGATSPPPHLPFFRGTAPVVAYLRHLGYRYVVAESPSVPGLYYYRFLLRNLASPATFSRAMAAYGIDWQGIVTNLETSGRYPVRRAGSLALITIGSGPTGGP